MKPIIDLKKENFFINNKQILFNINFQVNTGELVTILGQNGSGKSTLFKLIKQRYKKVYVLDQDINQATFSELSVYENILLASKNKADKSELSNYLSLFNPLLKDKLDLYVKELSGGQRQALALAMAFRQKPDILLLDEHTSALDVHSGQKIMELTHEQIKKNQTTTLMITHDLDHALKFSSRIIIINHGKIIFDIKYPQIKSLTKSNLLEMFF